MFLVFFTDQCDFMNFDNFVVELEQHGHDLLKRENELSCGNEFLKG